MSDNQTETNNTETEMVWLDSGTTQTPRFNFGAFGEKKTCGKANLKQHSCSAMGTDDNVFQKLIRSEEVSRRQTLQTVLQTIQRHCLRAVSGLT